MLPGVCRYWLLSPLLAHHPSPSSAAYFSSFAAAAAAANWLCFQAEWRYKSAAHLQAVWRGYVVRRDLAWQNYYATMLQRAWRRWFRSKDMWVKLFYLAQRKRYADVVNAQKAGECPRWLLFDARKL